MSKDKKKVAINQLRLGTSKGTATKTEYDVGGVKRYTGTVKEKIIDFYRGSYCSMS